MNGINVILLLPFHEARFLAVTGIDHLKIWYLLGKTECNPKNVVYMYIHTLYVYLAKI